MESTHLIRWSAVAMRGVVAVLFGAIAIMSPRITLASLIMLFGAFTLADGVLNFVAAARAAQGHQPFWSLIFEGLVSVAVGLLTFMWPGITALALLYVIAAWALITGIAEISAAIRLRKVMRGEWLLALAGVLSCVLGALLFAYPGAGALAVVVWIGAYSLVFGALLLALALRLRNWTRHPGTWHRHGTPSAA